MISYIRGFERLIVSVGNLPIASCILLAGNLLGLNGYSVILNGRRVISIGILLLVSFVTLLDIQLIDDLIIVRYQIISILHVHIIICSIVCIGYLIGLSIILRLMTILSSDRMTLIDCRIASRDCRWAYSASPHG